VPGCAESEQCAQLERERAKLAKANTGKARDETAVNTLFARMQHKQAKAEGMSFYFRCRLRAS